MPIKDRWRAEDGSPSTESYGKRQIDDRCYCYKLFQGTERLHRVLFLRPMTQGPSEVQTLLILPRPKYLSCRRKYLSTMSFNDNDIVAKHRIRIIMSTGVIIPQELLHSIDIGLFFLVVLFFIVIPQKFFPSHSFLRRRRKKALTRVRNRRDFGNGV